LGQPSGWLIGWSRDSSGWSQSNASSPDRPRAPHRPDPPVVMVIGIREPPARPMLHRRRRADADSYPTLLSGTRLRLGSGCGGGGVWDGSTNVGPPRRPSAMSMMLWTFGCPKVCTVSVRMQTPDSGSTYACGSLHTSPCRSFMTNPFPSRSAACRESRRPGLVALIVRNASAKRRPPLLDPRRPAGVTDGGVHEN